MILGLFALTGITHASTAEIIQPASIVYNENLTIHGQIQAASLQVGQEGIGGVTYFNGTIVNVGENVPVTIGDDLRVDGLIWRGPSLGQADGQALKFGDSLRPLDTNAFNLGFPNKRWKDLYLAGLLYGEDIIVGRELWGGTKKGIVDGDDPLYVSDSMYPTLDDINNLGSADNRWNDLYLSGMLQGNNAKFTGDVDLSEANVTGLPTASSDADTLDGLDSTDFALAVHDHDSDYYTKAQSDGRYLQLTGGILTGNISVSGVSGLTDSDIPDGITVNGYLPLSGGTVTGTLSVDDNNTLTTTDRIDVGGDYASSGGISLWSDAGGSYVQAGYLLDAGVNVIAGSKISGVNDILLDGANSRMYADSFNIGVDETDVSTMAGTLRIKGYTSDPGCTTSGDYGKLWYDTNGGQDKLKFCNTSGWQALH